MSVESGLSTFRSENGLWENHPVSRVATHEAWETDPEYVNAFHNSLPVCVIPMLLEVMLMMIVTTIFSVFFYNVPCIFHFSGNLYNRNSPTRKYTSCKCILHNNILCCFYSCHRHRLGAL